jgi:LemA protein
MPPLTVLPPLAELSPGGWVAVGAGCVLLLWVMGTYNGLVRARNHCDESWSGVETELKRRYDLIPNLVETVKGYARHERETFERVIEARDRARASSETPEVRARHENALTGGLRKLFAVAEAYPDLKASHNFLGLQEELTTTENRIQRSRRFYNANVRDLANRIETFPSNLLASTFGFRRREFFEIEESSQRQTPHVQLSD